MTYKEEQFINKKCSRKLPFKVSDDYIKGFNEQLVSHLPAQTGGQNVVRHAVIRPFINKWLVAASLSAVVFGAGVYAYYNHFSVAQQASNATQHAQYTDNEIDEFIDYSMIDNEDIYAYVSDN